MPAKIRSVRDVIDESQNFWKAAVRPKEPVRGRSYGHRVISALGHNFGILAARSRPPRNRAAGTSGTGLLRFENGAKSGWDPSRYLTKRKSGC